MISLRVRIAWSRLLRTKYKNNIKKKKKNRAIERKYSQNVHIYLRIYMYIIIFPKRKNNRIFEKQTNLARKTF